MPTVLPETGVGILHKPPEKTDHPGGSMGLGSPPPRMSGVKVYREYI